MGRMQVITIALLGVWLGWTLVMWFAAGRSFSTVDRVLHGSNSKFVEATRSLGPEQTRVVLRYLASEINRTFFRAYGWAQILLAAILLYLLWRQTPRDPTAVTIVGTMLGLTLILSLVVTPLIVSLGRSLDFLPREPAPPVMSRFWMLHGAFTALDGVKLLAGLGLLVRWVVHR